MSIEKNNESYLEMYELNESKSFWSKQIYPGITDFFFFFFLLLWFHGAHTSIYTHLGCFLPRWVGG